MRTGERFYAPDTEAGTGKATDFGAEEVAEIYGEGLLSEKLSLKPTNLEVVGSIAGQEVLDLGCGGGAYSAIFADAGARVTAVDNSKTQIERARAKQNRESIEYIVGDAVSLSSLQDASKDLVFMNMVLINVADKTTVQKIFEEARRVLRENGRLVFSMIHPLNLVIENKYDQTEEFDPKRYFESGFKYKAKALTTTGKLIEFKDVHHSLTDLSKMLRDTGFFIKGLHESKQVPDKGIYELKKLLSG